MRTIEFFGNCACLRSSAGSTFQDLATVYTEDGEYDKAIAVCEIAIAFDLHDWTKGDYKHESGGKEEDAVEISKNLKYLNEKLFQRSLYILSIIFNDSSRANAGFTWATPNSLNG